MTFVDSINIVNIVELRVSDVSPSFGPFSRRCEHFAYQVFDSALAVILSPGGRMVTNVDIIAHFSNLKFVIVGVIVIILQLP